MNNTDNFWHLTRANRIETQSALFEHLKRSNHLENTIYPPDTLTTIGEFRKYQLRNKIFERVSFAKTTIEDLNFVSCTFKECILIGVHFKNCEFHRCKFIDTNTHKIEISGTYIDPRSFKSCLDKKRHQNIGVYLYQILLKNSQSNDQIQFEREAQFEFMCWKRYQQRYEISQKMKSSKWYKRILITFTDGIKWLLSFLLHWMFGYGLRIRHFLGTILIVILGLSALNFLLWDRFGLTSNYESAGGYFDALYYTVVSLTTVGYGDIVPTTLSGRLVAALQSVIGFCSFAVLASMLYRKISP